MTIEPDAANLSGGQRQRIAIARALLHDSPVFVFDEATSSVDVESEELILATIRELVQSRSKTVIMITHRMANAEHCRPSGGARTRQVGGNRHACRTHGGRRRVRQVVHYSGGYRELWG